MGKEIASGLQSRVDSPVCHKTWLPFAFRYLSIHRPHVSLSSGFPDSFCFLGNPTPVSLAAGYLLTVSVRAIGVLLRSVCRFDVTVEGHSYAGFLVEWSRQGADTVALKPLTWVCQQLISYFSCSELRVPTGRLPCLGLRSS
jgi:hypothetical protein